MAPGTIVIYLADPLLYCKLLVVDLHPDGRLLCEAIHSDRHGEFARELFDRSELETFDRWSVGTVAA